MELRFRIQLQLAEAFGATNRWYCSQAYGCEVSDRESLLKYYITSGAAERFAKRFDQAMGTENRWYCSEFYGRDIRDPEILWNYYLTYGTSDARGKKSRNESKNPRNDLSIAS